MPVSLEEWETEPSVAVGEFQGLKCLLVRNNMGSWCGYVGIEPTHVLYGKHYNDIDGVLDVHGGLTYSSQQSPDGESHGLWWLGFDCGHATDLIPLLVKLLPSEIVLQGTYRNLAYVQAETEKLAKQLRDLIQSVKLH